jgi:hypothetical protein
MAKREVARFIQSLTPHDIWSTEMAKQNEREIAARAYRLWEAAGMPEGKDEEYWRLRSRNS